MKSVENRLVVSLTREVETKTRNKSTRVSMSVKALQRKIIVHTPQNGPHIRGVNKEGFGCGCGALGLNIFVRSPHQTVPDYEESED